MVFFSFSCTILICKCYFAGAAGEDSLIVTIVKNLEYQIFEGLEEYWIPLLIYSSAVTMSVILIAAALLQSNYWILCLIVG